MRPASSFFLILFLNKLRRGKFLKSLLSFDHRNGPKNLTESHVSLFPDIWKGLFAEGGIDNIGST